MVFELKMERRRWAEGVLRFVYDRLNARWSPAYAMADTERLLTALSRRQADLRRVAVLGHFFRPGGFVEFSELHLSEPVRHLARVSVARLERSFGVARGRIDWPRTYRVRAGSANPAAFVAATTESTHDAAENRVLAAYLSAAVSAFDGQFSGRGDLAVKAAGAVANARAALDNVYLRDVKRGAVPKEFERARAARHKRRIYSDAARLLAEIEAAVQRLDPEAVVRLAAAGWIEPLCDDDLFEVFVLTQTLTAVCDVISGGDWSRVTIRPVTASRGRAATFRAPDGTEADAFYDKAPHTVVPGFSAGEYRRTSLLEHYVGLDASSRRPDVILEVRRPGQKPVRLIVEAKNTEATSDYARDSLYKVLGYVSDFEAIWGAGQDGPRAVLVVAAGVDCIAPSKALKQEIYISVGERCATDVAAVLRHLLSANSG